MAADAAKPGCRGRGGRREARDFTQLAADFRRVSAALLASASARRRVAIWA
jgi:hypothetical protein